MNPAEGLNTKAVAEQAEPARPHTCCSHLAVCCAPAKAIQEWAGHTSLPTTMCSMHLGPGEHDRAIALLELRGTVMTPGPDFESKAARIQSGFAPLSL
jgi:hypothetical protein